eukprot:TRINITY_DN11963_c0_g1_i1.p3 TRINITY_DN11963_c0_g1~~TRINITY_DN11963_c0_g1_i1.p3  ORF type:complete len:58 (-),score=8.66 TRINITY_DN11963_c0_g1_i1:39-212(-)
MFYIEKSLLNERGWCNEYLIYYFSCHGVADHPKPFETTSFREAHVLKDGDEDFSCLD